YGALTGLLQENISGVRVVKAFTQEEHEIEKYTRSADELQRRSLDLARTLAARNPLMIAVAGVGTIFVIVAGGYLVAAGTVTIGTLVAFQYYLNKLYGPARRIGMLLSQYARPPRRHTASGRCSIPSPRCTTGRARSTSTRCAARWSSSTSRSSFGRACRCSGTSTWWPSRGR